MYIHSFSRRARTKSDVIGHTIPVACIFSQSLSTTQHNLRLCFIITSTSRAKLEKCTIEPPGDVNHFCKIYYLYNAYTNMDCSTCISFEYRWLLRNIMKLLD